METIILNEEEVTIHNNANNVDIANLSDHVGNVYLVFESGYGNSALINIVEAFDESEAVELCNIEDTETVTEIRQIK